MEFFLLLCKKKSRAIFSLEILRKSVRFWIFPVTLPLKSYLLGQDLYNAQWGADRQWHFSKRAVTFKGYSHCLKLTPEVMGSTIAQMQHFTGSYRDQVRYPMCTYNRNITVNISSPPRKEIGKRVFIKLCLFNFFW